MGQAKLRAAIIAQLKESSQYYYHGTKLENVASILADGELNPKYSAPNKYGQRVVHLIDTPENAANIVALRQTQCVNTPVCVFKIPKSSTSMIIANDHQSLMNRGIMRHAKAWYSFHPISIVGCEYFEVMPTLVLPDGVSFVRQGGKSGFTIDAEKFNDEELERVVDQFCI